LDVSLGLQAIHEAITSAFEIYIWETLAISMHERGRKRHIITFHSGWLSL